MAANPYLIEGPGLVEVVMTVEHTTHGVAPTVFRRWVNPLDYDHESRLAGVMAHDALTHRDAGAYPFVGAGDEPLALLQTAEKDWPATYAFVRVTVDGYELVHDDAKDVLGILDFLYDHPEKDIHWADCKVMG